MSGVDYWALEAQKARAEAHALRSELDAYKTTLRDEIDENLRLRGLGGARPDEGMTAYIERLIAERDALRAEVEALRAERDALQAEVDRLQLEYEPDEMSAKQVATWAESQVARAEKDDHA